MSIDWESAAERGDITYVTSDDGETQTVRFENLDFYRQVQQLESERAAHNLYNADPHQWWINQQEGNENETP